MLGMGSGRGAALLGCVLVIGGLLAPGIAGAQGAPQSLFSAGPGVGARAPGGGSGLPGATLVSPGGGLGAPSLTQPPVTLPSPPPGTALAAPAQVSLSLAARYGRDMPPISGALDWRIYADKPDAQGAFRLVREEKGAAPTLALPPGNYVVHCSFGLASAVKTVVLRAEPIKEVVDIPAGGLRMEGRVGNAPIPPAQVSFDVYPGSQFEGSEKRAVAQGVGTGELVLLPEGTYHIVSNYGDTNAVVRSDIRVQAGKLTDVAITHRAAVITLKLVNDPGGEALANTAWSVLTPGGDVIKESIGAFPRVILAEGDYRAIARNEGRVFERGFKVITGVDGEVEVLAH